MFIIDPRRVSASRSNKTKHLGFSLVELIVVILIIAILAVTVFAGGSAAIKKAQRARAISDLHNFQIAVATTMNENPQIANIEAATKRDKLSAIMNALNDNLPKGYKVTLQNAAMDGNISMDEQADVNANFIICKSEKTDPWDNPYFVIIDSAERGGSTASEFYITTVSAGPNAILNLTAGINNDDLFDLSSYTDGDVKSEIYDIAEAAPTVVGGAAAATSFTDPVLAPVNNGKTKVLSGLATIAIDPFDASALEEDSVAELPVANISANLSFQDDTKIVFRIHSLSYDESNYRVEYQFAGGSLVSKTLDQADSKINGYKFIVASCAAKQMTDTAIFKLYYNDAEVFLTEYSVRQYCVNKIDANTNSKLVALCRAILDYGAETQTYFSYNTAVLANTGCYGNGGSLPTIGEEHNKLNTSNLVSYPAGITKVNANMTLTGNIELNYKLTAVDVNKITDISVASSGNEIVTYEISDSGNTKTIKIKGIAVKHLDNVYTLSFNYDGVANSIQYSPLTYAFSKQNKTSDNLGRLCKSLYQCWIATNAYFD